jgi:putative CocE/NonD family hydrolase
VYTSAPLEEDLEVTGPVVAKIFASTDGPDTDFTAKLVDVAPDGYAKNLCDGIIRGRYRQSTERQVLLESGAVYEFTIDLWPTGNVFLKGHRIRVDISSSNFPRFDRNPNTGHTFAEDAELRVAHQQVLHDGAHASHIILPVIPKG